MSFYVRLGPRGILFRLGTLVIGVVGSAVYWRASRRRSRLPGLGGPIPQAEPIRAS